MTQSTPSLFINGLSIGTGGGYTVGRELARYIAQSRPNWRVQLAVIQDHPLQSEFAQESDLPDNLELMWVPADAASPIARMRYERKALTDAVHRAGHHAALQLNGMILPGLQIPTLAHYQDPFPYRPEAWTTFNQRVTTWFKRRANKQALRKAAVCGWTSSYLEKLITEYHGVKPKRSIVFYNGVPESWVNRAREEFSSWQQRPMKLVTVSNVWPYKRQSLVIEALALLRKEKGLEELEYHILGGGPADYLQTLRDQATDLGIGQAVHVEGRVSDERVEEALANARAMPLMSLCESFGIPTIEAMAYGTPVVVADCCALPEVCGDGAIVTPIDDVQALADSLRRLLTDPQLVEQQRRAGAERVARFQWKVIGTQMADVIEEMIDAS